MIPSSGNRTLSGWVIGTSRRPARIPGMMPSCDAPGWRQSRRWRRRCRSRRVPGTGGLDEFLGRAATPQPISTPAPPRNPHMAPDGKSNIHVDAYQSDTNRGPGPLGTGGIATTSSSYNAECASITFDARGRLVTVCVGLDRPTLRLIDPGTLDTIASYPLPPRTPGAGDPLTNFAGGGYFYLDDQDRAVVPTTERHIAIVAVRGDALVPDGDIDATSVRRADRPDHLRAARLRRAHLVRDEGGRDGHRRPGDRRGPRAAAGRADRQLVRRGRRRRLRRHRRRAVQARASVPRARPRSSGARATTTTARKKSGQTENGSGTTPTLTTSGYVAITDNADPIKVVVYRRPTARACARSRCSTRARRRPTSR